MKTITTICTGQIEPNYESGTIHYNKTGTVSMSSLSFRSPDDLHKFRTSSLKPITQFNVTKTRYCGCCKKHRSIRQFKSDEAKRCNSCK